MRNDKYKLNYWTILVFKIDLADAYIFFFIYEIYIPLYTFVQYVCYVSQMIFPAKTILLFLNIMRNKYNLCSLIDFYLNIFKEF